MPTLKFGDFLLQIYIREKENRGKKVSRLIIAGRLNERQTDQESTGHLLWPKWLHYIGTRLGEGSRRPGPRRFGAEVRSVGKGPQVLSEICHRCLRDLTGDTASCVACRIFLSHCKCLLSPESGWVMS